MQLPPIDSPYDEIGILIEDPCPDRLCAERREVFVDYSALGIEGMSGGEYIAYDYDEVTRAVTSRELPRESRVSNAVRLLVSEIGADRLVTNRYALLEAIGILYTVDNRLDRTVYDIENQPAAPAFPGCGTNGDWGSCANPEQYLGMATWRALDPQKHYSPDLLEQAVDTAVLAFYLEQNGFVGDFTGGATNYVHRCGAAAYGMTTPHCDAHLGRPAGDVAGANPFTGPIVFKGPAAWSERRGVYEIAEYRRIEYDPWFDVIIDDGQRSVRDSTELRMADGDALADADPEADGWFDEVVHVIARAPRFEPDPAVAAGADLQTMCNVTAPGFTRDMLEALFPEQ